MIEISDLDSRVVLHNRLVANLAEWIMAKRFVLGLGAANIVVLLAIVAMPDDRNPNECVLKIQAQLLEQEYQFVPARAPFAAEQICAQRHSQRP